MLQSGVAIAFALWRAHFNTAAADATVFWDGCHVVANLLRVALAPQLLINMVCCQVLLSFLKCGVRVSTQQPPIQTVFYIIAMLLLIFFVVFVVLDIAATD